MLFNIDFYRSNSNGGKKKNPILTNFNLIIMNFFIFLILFFY
jgi:hypothetical protein